MEGKDYTFSNERVCNDYTFSFYLIDYDLSYRYYDLRVAVKGSNIYSCHGLYGMDIVHALEILNQALLSHRQEVVILDFQHFYDFKDLHHLFLLDILSSIFGERLCTLPKNLSHVTLNWLQERGIQVVYYCLKFHDCFY